MSDWVISRIHLNSMPQKNEPEPVSQNHAHLHIYVRIFVRLFSLSLMFPKNYFANRKILNVTLSTLIVWLKRTVNEYIFWSANENWYPILDFLHNKNNSVNAKIIIGNLKIMILPVNITISDYICNKV